MGGVGSKVTQKGVQGLQKFKKVVNDLPTEGITQEELDRVLSQGSFRPKTDRLLKEATEKMNANMDQDGLSTDETIKYVQAKDEEFLSHLEGTVNKLASEKNVKPNLPFSSEGELPTERRDIPLEIKHIPGLLTSDEIRDLFGNTALLSSYEGQRDLAAKFDLTPENMDVLLKYVALPKLEKRREETKELDAVWPSWKKDIYIPFYVCYDS